MVLALSLVRAAPHGNEGKQAARGQPRLKLRGNDVAQPPVHGTELCFYGVSAVQSRLQQEQLFREMKDTKALL